MTEGSPDIAAKYALVSNASLEAAVVGLLTEVAQYPKPSDHPSHLGHGSNNHAFELTHDGQDLVIRVAMRAQIHPDVIKNYTINMSRSEGIENLEHVVASDPSRGIIVSTRVPGKNICKLTSDEINAITDDQMRAGINTIQTAVAAGITFDPKPSNLLYDNENGFGFVDFAATSLRETERQYDLSEAIAGIGVSLTNAQFYGHDRADADTDLLTGAIDAIEAGIAATERLGELTRETMEPDVADRVDALLTSQMKSMTTVSHDLKVQAGFEQPRPVEQGAWWYH